MWVFFKDRGRGGERHARMNAPKQSAPFFTGNLGKVKDTLECVWVHLASSCDSRQMWVVRNEFRKMA